MAKKKQTKKHKFKYAEPTGGTASVAAPVATPAAPAADTGTKPKAAPAAQVTVPATYGYVKQDLKRVALFGGGLVVVELILWWMFAHTPVGTTVYGWVRL